MAISKGRVQVIPPKINNKDNNGTQSRQGELQVNEGGNIGPDNVDVNRGVKQFGDLG